MNRDLFTNADPRAVALATMQVIDTTQRFQTHVQLHAMVAAFLLVAEHWGIPAQDLFTATKNLMNNQDGKRPEFAAVAMYIEKEL